MARAWVEAAVGPGSRVERATPLAGANTSALHGLTVRDRRGTRRDLVLRRYVLGDWLAREPDLAEREAEVLVILERSPLPTPELIAADTVGDEAGAPAVLMTLLPGTPSAVTDLPDVLVVLAEVLPALQTTSVPPAAGLRTYRSYAAPDVRPPAWSNLASVWARAIDLHDAWSPPASGVFIHRDYHPGNVLIVDGEVTGLVDWANASRGAPGVDVGHCRLNLAGLLGLDAADRFRDAWLSASGETAYDPTFDLLAAVGMLPELAVVLRPGAEQVDALVARAVAEIG